MPKINRRFLDNTKVLNVEMKVQDDECILLQKERERDKGELNSQKRYIRAFLNRDLDTELNYLHFVRL